MNRACGRNVNKIIHFRAFIKQKFNLLPRVVRQDHAFFTPVKDA